jgi:poly-beta-hydroxyalkanoate depolymerase
MTYRYIDLWITFRLFTGRQTLAVAAVAAPSPPLLAAAGAADAAPKQVSP